MEDRYRYRAGRPREDSTRGASRIIPKTYKGDVPTQVWLDSRYLAAMSNWLDEQGVVTRFLSEVVRSALELVVDNLVENGKVKMVEDTQVARDIIQGRYKIALNSSGRGLKNLQHNLTLTEARRKNTLRPSAHHYEEGSNTEMEEIRRACEEVERKKMEESIREQKEKAMNNPNLIKEEVVSETWEGMTEEDLRKQEEESLKALEDM